MLHSKHISTPANTTEANSIKTRFKVNHGVIFRVWLTFPAGCAGLLKFRMFSGGHPILPVDKDAFIRGDNFTFEYPLFVEILESPAQIIIETWNDDETFQHSIDVQILIIDRIWIIPAGAADGITRALRSLFVKPPEGVQLKGKR